MNINEANRSGCSSTNRNECLVFVPLNLNYRFEGPP